MSEFHFLRPYWFWALLPLMALVITLIRARAGSRSWATVCDPQLLPFLLNGKTGPRHRRWAPWLFASTGTLLVTALAGPAWERLPQPVFRDHSTLVVALDLSRSMDAGDVKPSRLTRAIHKITDILQQHHSGQAALLVYAGAAFTVTPLSDDRDTILAQLNSLETSMMPSQGSRADLALQSANDLLQQAGARRGHVLLVTDGIDAGPFEDALDNLRDKGHRLSILAVGTAEGAPVPLREGGFLKDSKGAIVVPRLNGGELQQWAQQGAGRYAQLRSDDRDIAHLIAAFSSRGLDQAERAADLQTDQWQEQGPWLILLVIPLVLLAFRRGVLMILPLLVLLPVPEPAQALDWSTVWSRPDQRAARAFEQGDAARAAQTFNDPEWKATAHYRAGDFAAAAASLENIETPDALYNRGNALAKSGKLPEAIASYQRTLELQPDHADARYNLELLQQQQQQSGEQQGDSASQQQESDEASQQGEQQQGEQQSADSGQPSEEMNQQDAQSGNSAQDESSTQEPQQQQAADAAAQSSEPPEPSDAEDNLAAANMPDPADETSDPATEQWLRRIPDDPGGLLRRKFLYQYQQRGRRAPAGDKPW